jgi:hypothetical protein
MNYISRDVAVIDLTSSPEAVMESMKSENLPAEGTKAAKIHIGKELYNTSIGEFDPPANGQPPIVGRMSKNGWGSCASCHTPFGLSDNVVDLRSGRGGRLQHTDFDQGDPTRKPYGLIWSAERDEQEGFELNIRNVSGGAGLIVLSDGIAIRMSPTSSPRPMEGVTNSKIVACRHGMRSKPSRALGFALPSHR